jgi:hypothetical protein
MFFDHMARHGIGRAMSEKNAGIGHFDRKADFERARIQRAHG